MGRLPSGQAGPGVPALGPPTSCRGSDYSSRHPPRCRPKAKTNSRLRGCCPPPGAPSRSLPAPQAPSGEVGKREAAARSLSVSALSPSPRLSSSLSLSLRGGARGGRRPRRTSAAPVARAGQALLLSSPPLSPGRDPETCGGGDPPGPLSHSLSRPAGACPSAERPRAGGRALGRAPLMRPESAGRRLGPPLPAASRRARARAAARPRPGRRAAGDAAMWG